MDLQIILIIILALLTLNLLILGFYVVLVLKDFRKILDRANIILTDFQSVTTVLTKPMGIVTGITEAFKAINTVRKTIKEEEFDLFKKEKK